MRIALLICGTLLLTHPVAAQRRASQPTPAPEQRISEQQFQARVAASDAAEQQVKRQLSSVEARLAEEERRLQLRLNEIANMRADALKKEDAKRLRDAEALEKQAFATYEARMQQLLGAIPGSKQASGAPTNGRPSAAPRPQASSNRNVRPTNRSSSAPRRSSRERSSSRTFGLWPFNR